MSYHIVHYGKDFLSYALRSVYDQVDELQILFTAHPSHGHHSDQPPPETREEIYAAAFAYDPASKIHWRETDIWQEGQQRDFAVNVCKQAGAEIVLVVDADEVWDAGTLKRALIFVEQENKARNNLVNMLHFWRSFNWVCRDNNWPVRFIDLRHKDGVAYVPKEIGDIYHFGYATTNKIMSYKLSIHGHKEELRKNWFENKWENWPPVPDCHPTNANNWWTPEPFDKTKLPPFMINHPFYNLERIE